MIQNQNTNSKNMIFGSDDLKVEDLPIHTMQDDLRNNNSSGDTKNFSAPAAKTFESNKYQPAIPKTSPFLPPKEPPKVPVNTLPESSEESSDDSAHNGLGKAILLGIIIFVIIVGGAGGYYYWMMKRKTAVIPEPVPQQTTTPEAVPPVPEIVSKFTKDKPNYLTVDAEKLNAAFFKDTISQTGNDLSQEKITIPIEFVITDSSKNPLSFSSFSNKIGIKLSKNLSLKIKDSFSLFIQNDGTANHLGLLLESSDPKTSALMLQEEKTLPSEIRPLFLEMGSLPSKVSFSDSSYNNFNIRYLNIISPEILSIDYTVINNSKIILGTTKNMLRSMLDYLSATPQNTAQPVDNL